MRSLSLLFAYAALAASTGTVATDLPLVVLGIFAAAFLAGVGLDSGRLQEPLLRPPVVVIATLLGILLSFVGVHAGNLYGRMLGVLALTAAAKLVSPKTGRDVLQIFLLNLLIVAAASLRRFGLEYGVLVLAQTFLSVAGLVFLYGSQEQAEIQDREVRHLLAWSGGITVGLLPATLVFFLILPRPTAALFGWEGGSASRTGFDERISAGEVEQVLQDPSPAFRVRWLRGERPERLHWRATVYETYRAGVWEQAAGAGVPGDPPSGGTVAYEVLMEPTGAKPLFALGAPVQALSDALDLRVTGAYTLEAERAVRKRASYRVVSVLPGSLPAGAAPSRFLTVPPELEVRLSGLAAELRRETPEETARAVAFRLRRDYTYDAAPGAAGDREPVERFLFETRRGHCEYFASAMALLLRTAGIPARVVGGYLGGEWNGLGEYLLVRQSRAHTWIEAWLPGKGWTAFDPTPSRGPGPAPGWSLQLAQGIDFLRYTWYRWVVTYDLGRQLDMVRRTASALESVRSGGPASGLPPLRRMLAAGGITALCLSLLWGLHRLRMRWRRRPRGWAERFVHLLEKSGTRRAPGETLQELAERFGTRKPRLRPAARAFVKAYYLSEFREDGAGDVVEARFRRLESALRG
jgi:transglutaminase-like putative cysteine protease